MFQESTGAGFRLRGTYHLRQISSGEVVDSWSAGNLVVNAGLDHALDVALSGGSQITSWFVGLKGAGASTAADTMSSHSGWSEVTSYDEATRVAWTDGGVSSQSVDNSGSVASFSINAASTVAGCFLTSGSTKSGTSGTLFSVADFASTKTLSSGDTLEVTYTLTAADDGS